MLAYIPAPWILWVYESMMINVQYVSHVMNTKGSPAGALRRTMGRSMAPNGSNPYFLPSKNLSKDDYRGYLFPMIIDIAVRVAEVISYKKKHLPSGYLT